MSSAVPVTLEAFIDLATFTSPLFPEVDGELVSSSSDWVRYSCLTNQNRCWINIQNISKILYTISNKPKLTYIYFSGLKL